jgi:WD40 repeat protein
MLKQLEKPGRALALSPDGLKLATAGVASGVDLWDVVTGQWLRTLPTDNSVWSLGFSPDGKRLVTAGWSSEPLVWNLAANQPPEKLTGHYLAAWSGGFSPDGSNIVTTGTDQTVRFWDAATLRLKNILRGHGNEVWCAAFSPDGKLLATGGKDQNVMLWSAEPRETRDTLPDDRNTRPIFSPDGTLVVTAVSVGPGGHSTLWKTEPRTSIAEFPPDEKVIGFSADGSRILSWDTQTPGLVSWSPKDNTTRHTSLAGLGSETGLFNRAGLDPTREVLFAIDGAGLVRFWAAGTGKLLGSLQGPPPPISAVAFSPGGKYLALSLERENMVRLYDRSTGREMQLAGHHDFVRGLAFSPDGATLGSGSMDGTIRLWDTATGGLVTTLPGHMEEVTDLAFSPDGRTLASLARKESVKLWHVATRRELLSMDLPEAFLFIQFSPDGRYLAVTTSNDAIRIFDAPDFEELAGPDIAQRTDPLR